MFLKRIKDNMGAIIILIWGIISTVAIVLGFKYKAELLSKDKQERELKDNIKDIAFNNGKIESEKEKQQEIKDKYENEKNKPTTDKDIVDFFNNIK
jgi:hypothetical protein